MCYKLIFYNYKTTRIDVRSFTTAFDDPFGLKEQKIRILFQRFVEIIVPAFMRQYVRHVRTHILFNAAVECDNVTIQLFTFGRRKFAVQQKFH